MNGVDQNVAEQPGVGVPQWLPPNPWAVKAHPWVMRGFCFSIVICWWIEEFLPGRHRLQTEWIRFIWIGLLIGTTMIGMARYLPVQQVVGAYGLVLIVFAPFWSIEMAFLELDRQLRWEEFIAFPAILFCARGVARLILGPIRIGNDAGYRVAVLGSMILWLTCPSSGVAILFVPAVIALLFNPWLINKHPCSLPMDLHPLIVWSLIALMCSWVSYLSLLRVQAGVGLAALVVVTILALRGYAQEKLSR